MSPSSAPEDPNSAATLSTTPTTTQTTVINALRQKLLCGRCSASKLMIWGKSSRGFSDGSNDMIDKPHGLQHDNGVYYLVRCDYFRLTVQSPDLLMQCDGFQARKEKGSAN